jgi:hypothetical protein
MLLNGVVISLSLHPGGLRVDSLRIEGLLCIKRWPKGYEGNLVVGLSICGVD